VAGVTAELFGSGAEISSAPPCAVRRVPGGCRNSGSRDVPVRD
jgi:hypothetical protein